MHSRKTNFYCIRNLCGFCCCCCFHCYCCCCPLSDMGNVNCLDYLKFKCHQVEHQGPPPQRPSPRSPLGGVVLWPTEARNNLCAFIIERDKAQCTKKRTKRIKQNCAKRREEGEAENKTSQTPTTQIELAKKF